MLHRIIGAAGSGKTEYMQSELGKAILNKRTCYVIVPEQQSVEYEAALCERFGDKVNLYCEVLNFERLPNRIAREYGDLAVNNIDKGGACALLSLVAEELKDSLTEYSSVAGDADFASSLFSLISRMKMALVTPEMINKGIEEGSFESNSRIRSKLHDIALIYSEYEKHFSKNLYSPNDALTTLSKELTNKPFFKNTCVFIDGYYTFTEQEYAIIKEIIDQSSHTYISFTVDESRSFFDENAACAKRLRNMARNDFDDYYTAEPKRFHKKSLAYIERNLFKSNPNPYLLDDGAVKLITAKNRFDEVEAACREICEYVRSGGRYKDIAVISGNSEAYAPIVDSVFSRAEIPVYMSSKEELAVKPLFSFLLSSIAVAVEDFSLESVKRYVKSGFTDLTVNECDVLLSYAQSWKLRGKAWYGEELWTLNPEGYSENGLSARGEKLLRIANQARDKIVPPLSALRDTLMQKGLTVEKALKALYNHLIAMNADEQLLNDAEKALKHGEREKSERTIQLWKHLINIFDQLYAVCGDKSISPKRLQSLIRLMCDCYSLGAIPAYADAVTFGSASLIRAGGNKMVIVLGVIDGEFPAAVQNGGFFSRDEAVILEEIGLPLADTMEKQLNTNRFFVYSAFAAPTDHLVLTCPRSELSGGDLRQSAAWLAIRRMLPELKEKEFDCDELYSREAIASNFPLIEQGELRDEISNALKAKNIEFFEAYPKVQDRESSIVFKDESLNLSPSKFETYAKCPFSFFGNYLLELKEKKINEFSMPEIGNFIHKILDQFMRETVESGSFVCPSESERKSAVDRLAKKYFLDVIGDYFAEDKQFMHTYKNMVRTIDLVAENLCNEFSDSDFIPTGFEFKIGLKNEDIPAINYDVNGKTVRLRGSIDRVDTYEANGTKYVRVIDYKTYSKPFSLDLVEYGLDSQLLHYLYAYCEKKDATPAGVFYYTVKLPDIKVNGRETDEEIKALIEKNISRNGILLNDPDVASAMSHSFKYVPAKLNKDGTLSKQYHNTYSAEEFKEISKSLRKKVCELANGIFDGKMDIAPLEVEKKNIEACKYCALGDICRNKKNDTDEEDDGYED